MAGALKTDTIMRRTFNTAAVNLHGTWSDERTIANTYWSQPRTDNTVSWLAIRLMPASDGTRRYDDEAQDVGRPRAFA